MEHYVCRGTCGGVADEPGRCGAEDCPRYKAPLEKCGCADGHHEVPPEAVGGREESKK